MHSLSPAVEALLIDVANTVVMPRYQLLEAHQIAEKTPGDLVTIADQESELRLGEGLAALIPLRQSSLARA
jgi:fructose-1,6-bisphosphatase/inositol monophosphatase family enzyme